MKFSIIRTILTTAAVCSLGVSSAQAADNDFSDVQRAAVKDIVMEVLKENPKVVVDALEAYQIQQEREEQQRAAEKIREYDEYFKSADLPFTGNPDGDIVVVEFFDYNCGYCKKALPDIQKIVDQDPNVKVVFKEMPILGPTSLVAAQWALAARKQDKYFEFHAELMKMNKPKNEENLTEVAERLGLNVEKMKKDVKSTDVQAQIEKSREIAGEVGVRGTPAFIVGEQFFPGYIGEAGLKNGIAKARSAAQPNKG